MNKAFVAGTRYFERDPVLAVASLGRLLRFIETMLAAGAERVFVAVNVAEDNSFALDQKWPERAAVFPVQSWGAFVNPLNSILITARPSLAEGCKLLIASSEVSVGTQGVSELTTQMGPTTLVVGAAVLGHQYEPGVHQNAKGRQVPWNTLALWNPKFLWTTGFLLLGEGPLDSPENRGVEELLAITVLQHLYSNVEAKLVLVTGQNWDVSHFPEARLREHEKKMATKDLRPASQLRAARFRKGPTVIHV